MGKKNKDWCRHISEDGNYGNERECDASKYVLVQIQIQIQVQKQIQTHAQHATTTTTITTTMIPLPNNDHSPNVVLKSLVDVDSHWTMIRLGKKKLNI